jgi:hypothetical protein
VSLLREVLSWQAWVHCILTKMLEIKVCEAPESKRMVAGVE